MKKVIFGTAFLLSSILVNAQSEKYVSNMTELVKELQTQYDASLVPLVNKMERIANAEPKEWLPSYWVAYGLINESYRVQENDAKEVLLDKAEEYLKKAEAISSGNAELEILRASFSGARLVIDPMSRWQKYGALFEKHLAEASKLDSGNPRIDYLKATNLYYTPESFGGGKEKAKVLFRSALKKFEVYKSPTTYSPAWGKIESEYFLGQ